MKTFLRAFTVGLLIFSSAHAASIRVTGSGMWWPKYPSGPANAPAYTTVAIDATGEKKAACGPIWFAERTGTKDIQKIGFRFGAVTKAGGSDVLVSLRDVNATVGPPKQPDDTDDQSYVIFDTSTTYATNTWFETDPLTSNRTVTYGESFCVVWQFNGARAGADTFILSHLAVADRGTGFTVGTSSLSVAAPWTVVAESPVVVFQFTDGTYGMFDESYPFSSIASANINSGTTPDEKAITFWNPFPIKIDAIWMAFNQAGGGAAGTLRLYEGTTSLESVTISSMTIYGINASKIFIYPFAERTLTANTTYYVALAPGASANMPFVGFASEEVMNVYNGGHALGYTERTDAGSWAPIQSSYTILGGVRISSLDDGAGGAAGTRGYPFFQ